MEYSLVPSINHLGVESETCLRRGGVNGYGVGGIANVPSGARHIGRDEHLLPAPHTLHMSAFPVHLLSSPAARQDERHIWRDSLVASLPDGYRF